MVIEFKINERKRSQENKNIKTKDNFSRTNIKELTKYFKVMTGLALRRLKKWRNNGRVL